MAAALKDALGAAVVEQIEQDLLRIDLSPGDFAQKATAGLLELELLDRGRHIARALRAVLPADGAKALDTLVRALGPELESHEEFGTAPFRYLPHIFLIGELGPDHLEQGLRACHEITRRFTAEWCVRPLLVRHPDRVFETLTAWTTDPNVHVRRLVSEGTRPRLPWAPRIEWEERYLGLLEALKDDPAEYVRRSVANHLGDVAKDRPELVVERLGTWLAQPTPARFKLARHALRHPVKQGHAGALQLLGFEAQPGVLVEQLAVPDAVRLGETLQYTFEVVNTTEEPQEVVVDVVVGYRKARCTLSPKVFKLTQATLAPGERRELRGKLALRDLSTRRHHLGEHTLQVQVNGQRHPPARFVLEA
jgi:3-methyladenine DNA glycosylase AlkC